MSEGRKRSTSVRHTPGTKNVAILPPAIRAREAAQRRVDPSKIKINKTLKQTIAEELSKRSQITAPSTISISTILEFETYLEGLVDMKLKGEQLSSYRATEDGERLITTSFGLFLYFEDMEKNRIRLNTDEFHLKASVDFVINLLYSYEFEVPKEIGTPKADPKAVNWDNW